MSIEHLLCGYFQSLTMGGVTHLLDQILIRLLIDEPDMHEYPC